MFNWRSFSRCFFLFIVLAFISGAAAAQEKPVDPPVDPAALPFGGTHDAARDDLNRIDKLGDWSLITYQKLTNQNWDIYVHGPAGPRRLTTSGAVDQHPSLDRGTERVAFVSNRGGDFDLYRVNVDGGDLRRLLDNRATIAFPAWSPDGTRIAIQAGVNNQYEIFTVDANGQNPQRLTQHPGFDGMPTWSPDGKQLAFTSNRSGDYHIYIMNADGSGVRRLSNYRNSLHPSWSPDGATIAFDADIDGDGWQELALINANGLNQRMIHNPGGNVTAWVGSWAPDNSGIGFNEITAEQRQGNWVWTKAVIRKWNRTGGVFDLIAGGREWYMKWESADNLPPLTAIEPLADYTKAAGFTLRWSGRDQGGSGIQFYDVYFNNNDGEGWQTFLRNTTRTESAFPARSGTTVDFLVRATDNAFNRAPWSLQTTERTTFYRSKVQGSVYDNRGNPLSGVPIVSSTSVPGTSLVSGWNGDFTDHRFKDEMSIISIQEPHFKVMPDTIVPAGEDFLRAFYLMPADSLINNGTFESDSSEPVGWTVAGNIGLTVTDEASASGENALRFGQPAHLDNLDGPVNAGTASISQVVTIPDSMPEPTLSYMLRSAAVPPTGNSGLRVLIQPPINRLPTSTSVVSSDRWQIQWIDMTPYQGQTVTVTFEWVQNAGETLPTLYLDDVSLGSSNPDLWSSLASGPASAAPGEIATITLDYGNRGSSAAEAVVIELALPTQLEIVSATPPFEWQNNVVRWEVGDLGPHSASQRLNIQVSPRPNSGGTAVLKSLVHAQNAESHLRNNISQATILVAENVYLPLLVGGSD